MEYYNRNIGRIPAEIQEKLDRRQQLDLSRKEEPQTSFDSSMKYRGFCTGYAQIKIGDFPRIKKALIEATTVHRGNFHRIRLGKQQPTPQMVARVEEIFHSVGIFDIWDE